MKRIIVIGGGLGGLSAALALRRAGADATVYHSGEFAEVPAAVVIWPNAARVLRNWGLLGPLLENGQVLRQIELLKPDGKAMASIPLQGADEPAVCLHRAELHSALRSALPEASLVPNRRLVSLTRGATEVNAEFEGGLTSAADGLVGADGARSAVRALAGSGVAPAYRGYRVWRAIASDPGGFKRDRLSETWGHGRRFGIVPMGRERVCWYATHNGPPLPQAANPADTRRHLQTLFAGWHDPVRALIEATDPEGIVGADACDAPPLPHWGKGRVTLLGDAAHPLTPNVGQGACSAIEDAAVLARCAQEAADLPEAFFAYESERRPLTAALNRRARRIGVLGQLENPCLVAARDWTIRAAMKLDIVRLAGF